MGYGRPTAAAGALAGQRQWRMRSSIPCRLPGAAWPKPGVLLSNVAGAAIGARLRAQLPANLPPQSIATFASRIWPA